MQTIDEAKANCRLVGAGGGSAGRLAPPLFGDGAERLRAELRRLTA